MWIDPEMQSHLAGTARSPPKTVWRRVTPIGDVRSSSRKSTASPQMAQSDPPQGRFDGAGGRVIASKRFSLTGQLDL